ERVLSGVEADFDVEVVAVERGVTRATDDVHVPTVELVREHRLDDRLEAHQEGVEQGKAFLLEQLAARAKDEPVVLSRATTDRIESRIPHVGEALDQLERDA